MEYNTQRAHLRFTDYGRNIYKMIEYAKTIKDRAMRTEAAKQIVDVMATITPSVKEDDDYRHKLWDHLMMASNFELDVDCPFPVVQSQSATPRPKRMQYKDNQMRFRHYGRCMESMIKKVVAMPDGEERQALIRLMANQMKKSYIEWNDSSVNDDLIIAQMEQLAGNDFKVPQDLKLVSVKDRKSLMHVQIPDTPAQPAKKKKKKKKKK